MSTDGLHQPRATTALEQQLENFTPNSHHSSGWMRRIPAWQQDVCTVSAFQQQVSRSHFAPKNIWAGTRLLFSQQHWDCLMSICSLHIGAERNQCALDSPNAQLRPSISKFRISQIFMLLKPAYKDTPKSLSSHKKNPHEASPLLWAANSLPAQCTISLFSLDPHPKQLHLDGKH